MTDFYLYSCGGCGTLHAATERPPKYPCYVCKEIHWHEFTGEPDDKMQKQKNGDTVGFYTDNRQKEENSKPDSL